MNKQFNKLIIPILLIILGLTARLLPHPPNFTPIAAIALFGGLYLPKRWAIIAPLVAVLISDIFIGFYNWKMMLAVYGSFALMGYLGLWAKKNKSLARVVGGTLIGSILFFLVTNWSVWAFGTMYAKTLTGLIESYTLAIPFFRNSLLGNLFYVTILVGSMELVLLQKNNKAKNIATLQ
jgi:uncharacterized membrane protein